MPRNMRVAVYVLGATILLGSLYAEYQYAQDTDAASAATVRSRHTEAHPETVSSSSTTTTVHGPPPYFADKRNILNQLLVKKAWAWTTLLISVHLLLLARARAFRKASVLAARWSIATMWWILVTAWFFGPSLTVRVLVYSGAQCIDRNTTTISVLHPEQCLGPARIASWQGGHDISGHTFLLTLSSLLLLSSLIRTLSHLPSSDVWRTTILVSTISLVGIWWWMILMTSIYFHHIAEKLSGYAIGVVGWLLTEYLALLVQ